MKRWNYERNRDQYDHQRPLEELIDMAILAPSILPVDEALRSISSEFSSDARYIREMITEKRSRKRSGLSNKQQQHGDASNNGVTTLANIQKEDLSSIRLNLLFGSSHFSFNYNRRVTRERQLEMIREQLQDRDERLRHFYENDVLDEDITLGRLQPRDSKMFHQLIQTHQSKYRLGDGILRDAASLLPKVDPGKPVDRAYIQQYRLRPVEGDELCANGALCVFNTLYRTDKNARYIGKVFRTEEQKAWLESRAYRASQRRREQIQKRQTTMDPRDDNEERYWSEKGRDFEEKEDEEEDNWEEEDPAEEFKRSLYDHGLCIDCLLKFWTIQHDINVSNEIIAERQFNYFTVKCGPGQYSSHVMLKVMENGRMTGIFGDVPRFSASNRRRRLQPARPLELRSSGSAAPTLPLWYIDEKGMDFQCSLSEGNTCMGCVKSQPLTDSQSRQESIVDSLWLLNGEKNSEQQASVTQEQENTTQWWCDFRGSFCDAIMLDRHFLLAIEEHVSIGGLLEEEEEEEDAGEEKAERTTSITENLRLIFARQFDNRLNFRELPVSLLRLYFSGKGRLQRCVRRLETRHRRELFNIFLKDCSDVERRRIIDRDHLSGRHSPEEQEKKRSADVYKYLVTLLDLCLCSFETTLTALIRSLATAVSGRRWLAANVFHCLRHDTEWENLPIPEGIRRVMTFVDRFSNVWSESHDTEMRRLLLSSNSLVWLACVWRMHITHLVENLLRPWESDEAEEWLIYQFRLFRDTHLDLMTDLLYSRDYDDNGRLSRFALREFYPACYRVICVEELPDFIKYTSDNFRTGAVLKDRSSLDDQLGHILGNKTGNNRCKVRNADNIIITYSEKSPFISDVVKNILRCTLLGNLPKSRGRMHIVARIRVNFSFLAHADRPISEADFKERTRFKSNKKSISKKKQTEELEYDKTEFKLWLILCRHFVLYLLKEYFFYISESSQSFDELMSVDFKTRQHQIITRLANGRCREELSRQAKRLPLSRPFEWHVIEYEMKAKGTATSNKYDIKSGEIKKCHVWALNFSRKVKKDECAKIMRKKMTGVEEELSFERNSDAFDFIDMEANDLPLGAPKSDPRLTLDEFHFIWHYMSKNLSPIFETRWFQVMGMSEKGIHQARDFLFRYYTYDTADDAFKKKIKKFAADNFTDYLILKCTIIMIEHYRQREGCMFQLPIDCAKRQMYALRQLLNVDPWMPTPALLGISHQCQGCLKFSNLVVPPQPVKNHQPVQAHYEKLAQEAEETRQEKKRLKILTLAGNSRKEAVDIVTAKKRRARGKSKSQKDEKGGVAGGGGD